MVQNVLNASLSDIQLAKQAVANAKTLIQVQKDAGESTSAQEAELATVEAKIAQYETAINKQLKK